MAEIAGDAWRLEYEQAWAGAFAVVAGAMVEGAEAARAWKRPRRSLGVVRNALQSRRGDGAPSFAAPRPRRVPRAG